MRVLKCDSLILSVLPKSVNSIFESIRKAIFEFPVHYVIYMLGFEFFGFLIFKKWGR